jgi:ribonucleoside-triphosphate reductase
LQDRLQTKYTGGTVLHVLLGEQLSDTAAVKNLVRKIATNYRLPYFTLTPTFSVCPSHGYLAGEQERCAHCNQETEIYSRVVGYLRPVKQWNDGKQAEYAMRKTYRVDSVFDDMDNVPLPSTQRVTVVTKNQDFDHQPEDEPLAAMHAESRHR